MGIDGAQGALGLAAVLAEYRAISMAARNFAARTRVEYARDLAELVAFLLGIEIAEPAN